MVTPAIKDLVLNTLIDSGPELMINIHEAAKDFNMDRYYLSIILDQFEQKGFLNQRKSLGGGIFVSLTADAFDFKNHGGFVGQEELLEKNLQKLILEIESLKPSFPDKAERIASIIGGISGALGLFIK